MLKSAQFEYLLLKFGLFVWFKINNCYTIINIGVKLFKMDIIFGLIVTLLFSGVLIIFFRKTLSIIPVCALLVLSCVAFVFKWYITGTMLAAIFIVALTVFLVANISEIRKFIVLPQTPGKKKQETVKYSKETLYRIIDDAVHSLSRTKTGGIMTFERSTNLDDILKNGTVINAPVSQELLETIFYEGTRLHDGAVVIRDNMIIAASVYFTPTTKALTGKYGSRHRAAIGISEISDAVTVVVSEETGRVSIAHNGTIEPISLDLFLSEFTDLMSEK